jgi:hypothetical protein
MANSGPKWSGVCQWINNNGARNKMYVQIKIFYPLVTLTYTAKKERKKEKQKTHRLKEDPF